VVFLYPKIKKREENIMSILPNPLKKIHVYLKAIVTGETENLPEPTTRTDAYLKAIAEKGLSGGESVPTAWADIAGKPSTFPPTIGTTATTAKAGNYVPAWTELTGKPAVIGAGADAAAARTAIGAGTPYTLPAATASVIGGVKQATTQAASTAEDVAGVVTDLNALIAKLKTAGIMA